MQEVVRQYFDRASCTYTYLVHDGDTAVIIDPVWEHREAYIKELQELGLKLDVVMDTHVHADHKTCANWLKHNCENSECFVMTPATFKGVSVWGNRLHVIETPGHTQESVCIVLRRNYVFTGDTLLVRKCGRSDFQGGSAADLYDSIHMLYEEMPDKMIVYPGHDYDGKQQSTIGEEKKHNIRCTEHTTKAEFIKTMNELKLAAPKHLKENVEHNTYGGPTDKITAKGKTAKSQYGVVALDIDDTVLVTDGPPNYDNPVAIAGAKEAIDRLWAEGFKVDFFTARHHRYYDLTVEQLDKLGFKYRRLMTGKPLYDFLVDDRGIHFTGSWEHSYLEQLLEKLK